MDYKNKNGDGKQNAISNAVISGFLALCRHPLDLRVWRASLFLETQETPTMAKKKATQPEVAKVWDDETPEDETTYTPSEDDGDTGTEADSSDLDDPTDDDLAEVGDIIDGTEDDITDLEQQEEEDLAEVASDVGGDESSPVTAAVKAAVAVAKRKKVKEVPMAEKMTKADHVRAEIDKRVKAGEEGIRPRDIIAALEKKGVTVTAPQVSVMLKKALGGKTAAPKAEKPVRAASAVKKPMPKATEKKAAAATKPTKPGKLEKQQFDLLFDAASFVEKCGSVESAINALSAYERLTALRS